MLSSQDRAARFQDLQLPAIPLEQHLHIERHDCCKLDMSKERDSVCVRDMQRQTGAIVLVNNSSQRRVADFLSAWTGSEARCPSSLHLTASWARLQHASLLLC